ncbi:PREDICTED: uncharacterized protein LOC106819365 [Priapulus caudatus]|uniref:Uncharacterized protein LOC106819365 n=1 Tax=Priapulus caudatus TaxID=37621 RepID=A0ABM1F4X6_PRICU|nr:PREDICTED: uncharacterized protein LOC106819365 [Priapulus caudatus]
MREMERYLDLFPVPFKIIGNWIVDQGGSGEFAMMSQWESQTQRKEALMKYMTDPGFEFYLSRIGPMCHTFHKNTLRACPGFEMSIPSKPSEYEMVMYRFKHEGQSTEVLFTDMGDMASDLRSHMAKLGPDTGGVVGAWFTEYGTPGDMAVVYHYPDMQWRENVFWPSMVSGDFKKTVETWGKKLDKVTNRSLIVVPNQQVLLK